MPESLFSPYMNLERISTLYNKLCAIDFEYIDRETYLYVTGALDALMVVTGEENKLSKLLKMDITTAEELSDFVDGLQSFLKSLGVVMVETVEINEEENNVGTEKVQREGTSPAKEKG